MVARTSFLLSSSVIEKLVGSHFTRIFFVPVSFQCANSVFCFERRKVLLEADVNGFELSMSREGEGVASLRRFFGKIFVPFVQQNIKHN